MTQQVPSEEEVLSYFDALSNWGRWGADDELGTLNLVSPAKRIAAAELVRVGITVSWDIGGTPPISQQGAVQRLMLGTGQGIGDAHRVVPVGREGRSSGAGEHLGIVYHGYTVTHVDGLSHIFWDGRMYNGKPAELVTASFGATHHGITALRDGVQTRGVLLDIAALRDVAWLEPGEPVFPSDLEAAEGRAGVRIEEGDVLLLRTGYGRK